MTARRPPTSSASSPTTKAKAKLPRGTLHKILDVIAKGVFGGDPSREYQGQAWTFTGARGKRTVHATYRDVGDVIARELAAHKTDDPMALVQNVLRRLELDTGDAWGD